MSARKLTVAALISLCVLVGALALGSVSAQAAVTHKYISSPITEVPAKGPPPKEEAVAFPGLLGGISNMTVDSGELYLIRGGDLLDKFNASTGAFVAQFPQPSEPYFDFHQGLAVGHGTGETEVYVSGDEGGTETQGRVAVYDAAGHIQDFWNGSDTPAGHFGCFECGGDGGVAADNSGNLLTKGRVYVVDPLNDVVDVFEPKAGGGEKYLTQITGPEPKVPFTGLGEARSSSVTVNQFNGDVLVTEGASVDVFEPTALGEYVLVRRLTGTPGGAFERVSGVTADGGSGDIYVWEAERQVVDQFSAAGVYLGHLTGTANTPAGAFGSPGAVAVDPATGDVYVGDIQTRSIGQTTSVDIFGPSVLIPDVTTEAASSVKPRSTMLNGTVDPDEAGAATCRFEWGTSPSFGNVVPCEPEAVADGNAPVAVQAALSGLQTDTTYYYRLTASNSNGTNPGESFQTQEFSTAGPGIHQESASTVTSASASLDALIDPDNAATTYYFQYGTSTAYGTDLPAAPGLGLGTGKGDLSVSVHLQGLEAATIYHYRVVALSEPNGEPLVVEGPDETFTTQAAGSEIVQPDGRQWEMVSPPNKQGAAINAIGVEGGSDIQASARGDGITYTASSPFVANPAGSRSIEATQVLSTRSAPGVWNTSDITLPHNNGVTGVAVGHSAEYKLFSTDLSVGLVQPPDDTPLPPLPANADRTLYLRTENGEYKALVTATNTPPGTQFGATESESVKFTAASPDLSHIVLESEVQLTSTLSTGGFALYEWSGGQLQPASVLPGPKVELVAAALGDGDDMVRHAVSDDGSRVIWSPSGGGHLYMRDMVSGETVAVDAAQTAPEPKSGKTRFETANAAGSRVFFLSSNRLTADSTAPGDANSNVEDLYEFEVTSGSGDPLAGRLTDLTVDQNAGESAGVQGVIGASADGSSVYFVAHGVLGDAAAHGATSGNNLYLEQYDEEAGTWLAPRFIASLSSADLFSWGGGIENTNLAQMTSRVSPNGRYMAFMSEQSLTGYDNRDANSDMPDEEVFLYDADSGRLVCASCNPTGARPVGIFTGEVNETLDRLAFGNRYDWVERWVAGNIPGWTNKELSNAIYQSRYLSDSGRLFFNSSDALVPADVNGQEDVYEYQPEGAGGCQGSTHGQSASAVFDERAGGCVGLISAGTSSGESAFLDASETGGDVFFLTLSRLATQDHDTSLDIYDAHECTIAAPGAPAAALAPPPCTTGDACKAAPTPQPTLFGAPSSETFSGAGNIVPSSAGGAVTSKSSVQAKKLAKALRACGKRPKRKRAACRRQAKRRYGAKLSRARKSSPAGSGR